MARIRMKRYFATSIVLVTITACYFLYSLNSNHHTDRLNLVDKLPHHRVVVNVQDRDRMRRGRKGFRYNVPDLPAKRKHDSHKFQLFPEGLRAVDRDDHAADLEDSGVPGVHRVKQQQKEQNAKEQGKDTKRQGHAVIVVEVGSDKFSKDSDNDDLAPDQPIEHRLVAPAPEAAILAPLATASVKQLVPNAQRNGLPKADRNGQDMIRKDWEKAMKGKTAKDVVMKRNQHSDDKVFPLAIDGVQKRKSRPVAANHLPLKSEKVVDAVRLFQNAQQKGRPQVGDRNVRLNKPPQHIEERMADAKHHLRHNEDVQHHLQHNRDAHPQQQLEKSLPTQAEKNNVADAMKKFEELGRRRNVKVVEPQQRVARHNRVGDVTGKNEHQVIHKLADPHREIQPMDRHVARDFDHNVVDRLNAAKNQSPRPDQRRHDLIKDRFKEDRNSFQNIAETGFKRESKVAQRGSHQELKHSINKRENREGHHQAEAKEGSVRVAVENLSQPVTVISECVPLKLNDGWDAPRVCVYPNNRDSGASRQLERKGTWEKPELAEFLSALSTNSSLGAVDVGAGMGVYTVAAASRGHHVLAVEPLQDSQLLFTKTIQVNSFTERVVLVLDALGEKIGVGRLHVPRPFGNMGSVFVQRLNLTVDNTKDIQDLVKIVRLDDVLPLVKFSSAVLKLDVQGDDGKVLQGAVSFFSKIDVRYVLMHWFPTENSIQYKQIQAFLEQRGFEPARTARGTGLYSDAELQKDISFVVWRKRAVGGV